MFEVAKRSICEIVPSQAFIVAFPVGSLGRLICPPCRLGRGRFAALTSTLEAAHEGEIGARYCGPVEAFSHQGSVGDVVCGNREALDLAKHLAIV